MSSLSRTFVWIALTRCLVSTWLSSTSTLPTADYGSAIGALDGKIYILGGHSHPKQVTEYHIDSDTFVDIGQDVLTTPISGLSQFWTQRQQTVYAISPSTSTITAFNLRTQSYTSTPWDAMDHTINTQGCLTSSTDYLFLVGGNDPSFQAFDFIRNTWIPNAPSMHTPRMYAACVTHGNYLWALGGHSTDYITSNERISITNITQNPWITSDTPSLTQPVLYARAVSHEHYIFIIGGSYHQQVLNTVQIIDTRSGMIRLSSDILPYAMDSTGSIYYHGFIYLFGGRTDTHPSVFVHTLLYKRMTDNSRHHSIHLEARAEGDSTAIPTISPSPSPTSVPSVSDSGDKEEEEQAIAGVDNKLLVLTAVCLGLVVLLLSLLLALVCWKRKKEEAINKELEDQYLNNIAMGLQQQEMAQKAVTTGGNDAGAMDENDILEQVLAMSAFEQKQGKDEKDVNGVKPAGPVRTGSQEMLKESADPEVNSPQVQVDEDDEDDDNEVVDEGLDEANATAGINDDYKQDVRDVMDRPHAASLIPAGDQRVLNMLTGVDDNNEVYLEEANTGDTASDSDDDVLVGVENALQTTSGGE